MGARVLVVPSDVKRRRPYNSPLRAEQANGTRHRVLAAATDLFLQRGYTGTTITAVAEAAGVSPDTVYVSLGGKQGRPKVPCLSRSPTPKTGHTATKPSAGKTSSGSPTRTSGCAASSSSAARRSPEPARSTP